MIDHNATPKAVGYFYVHPVTWNCEHFHNPADDFLSL
jgi:hypothetical protein